MGNKPICGATASTVSNSTTHGSRPARGAGRKQRPPPVEPARDVYGDNAPPLLIVAPSTSLLGEGRCEQAPRSPLDGRVPDAERRAVSPPSHVRRQTVPDVDGLRRAPWVAPSPHESGGRADNAGGGCSKSFTTQVVSGSSQPRHPAEKVALVRAPAPRDGFTPLGEAGNDDDDDEVEEEDDQGALVSDIESVVGAMRQLISTGSSNVFRRTDSACSVTSFISGVVHSRPRAFDCRGGSSGGGDGDGTRRRRSDTKEGPAWSDAAPSRCRQRSLGDTFRSKSLDHSLVIPTPTAAPAVGVETVPNPAGLGDQGGPRGPVQQPPTPAVSTDETERISATSAEGEGEKSEASGAGRAGSVAGGHSPSPLTSPTASPTPRPGTSATSVSLEGDGGPVRRQPSSPKEPEMTPANCGVVELGPATSEATLARGDNPVDAPLASGASPPPLPVPPLHVPAGPCLATSAQTPMSSPMIPRPACQKPSGVRATARSGSGSYVSWSVGAIDAPRSSRGSERSSSFMSQRKPRSSREVSWNQVADADDETGDRVWLTCVSLSHTATQPDGHVDGRAVALGVGDVDGSESASGLASAAPSGSGERPPSDGVASCAEAAAEVEQRQSSLAESIELSTSVASSSDVNWDAPPRNPAALRTMSMGLHHQQIALRSAKDVGTTGGADRSAAGIPCDDRGSSSSRRSSGTADALPLEGASHVDPSSLASPSCGSHGMAPALPHRTPSSVVATRSAPRLQSPALASDGLQTLHSPGRSWRTTGREPSKVVSPTTPCTRLLSPSAATANILYHAGSSSTLPAAGAAIGRADAIPVTVDRSASGFIPAAARDASHHSSTSAAELHSTRARTCKYCGMAYDAMAYCPAFDETLALEAEFERRSPTTPENAGLARKRGRVSHAALMERRRSEKRIKKSAQDLLRRNDVEDAMRELAAAGLISLARLPPSRSD